MAFHHWSTDRGRRGSGGSVDGESENARRLRGLGGRDVVVEDAVKKLFPPEPAAHEEFGLAWLLLLLLPWRSDGPASVHATVDVLLFLLCWFQDLTTGSRQYEVM